MLQDGWTQVFGDSTVTLGVGEDIKDLDFGNFQNVSISGHKWEDVNGDGKWQTGTETPIGDWTIQLKDDQGNLLNTDITANITGMYSFENIAPGTYTLCEVMQTGWVATAPESGCQDVKVARNPA